MKISGKTLLTIDRLFWLPHRVVERLLHVFGNIEQAPGDQILVIKFMGIGSIIRLASLCDVHHVDKSKITLLTLASNRDVCQLVGFSNHWLVRTKNIILFLSDCWKILFSVRSSKPALIIDYERCTYAVGLYRTLLTLLGRTKSISFESRRTISSSKQIIYPVDEINQEELFMKGIELMPTSLSIHSQKMVTVHSTKILININASNYLLARRYSIDSFAEVIKSLHALDPQLEFYLTGSSDETDCVARLAKKLHNLPIHNVAGKWNLEKLSNELLSCALFITGDSGPLHLAAYLQVPTLAIWGPTQPEHFGYIREAHMHHISLNLHCSPCFKHPASHPARACKGQIDCLKNLAATRVSEKAIDILSSQSALRHPDTAVTHAIDQPQHTS